MSFRTKLTITVLTILISTIALNHVHAWVETTNVSPGNNIFAPLNSSAFGQSKIGGLILNLGGATHGLIVRYGRVGIGTENPQSELDVVGKIRSTGLEIVSTTAGVLFPSMTKSDITDKIKNPIESMLVYNLTDQKFNFWQGGEWKEIGGGTQQVAQDKIVTESLGGDGNNGDYYCKRKEITAEGQQKDWVKTNEGKLCGTNDKICQNGECKELICGVDLYKTGVTCSAVGTGYYSPATDNNRYACTNKPSNSVYTGPGGGTNNCPWSCDTNYTQNGATCTANTRTFTCSANPANTNWNTVNSYTQTWNGSSWTPADSTTTYNTTASTNSCRYTCAANYNWNGSSCVPSVTITALVWGDTCASRCSALGKTCVSIGRDAAASDGNHNINYGRSISLICRITTLSAGNCNTRCGTVNSLYPCCWMTIETRCRCQ